MKLPAGEGKFTVIPLTDENVYSICPVCGEEHQIDITDRAGLVMEAVTDYITLQVCCGPCTKAIKKEGLDALMEHRKESLAYHLGLQSSK